MPSHARTKGSRPVTNATKMSAGSFFGYVKFGELMW